MLGREIGPGGQEGHCPVALLPAAVQFGSIHKVEKTKQEKERGSRREGVARGRGIVRNDLKGK